MRKGRTLDIKEVACALQSAKTEAARLTARVRAPILIVTTVLTLLAYGLRSFKVSRRPSPIVNAISHVAAVFGAMGFFLAIMPSDRWAPKLVVVLKVVMWLSVTLSTLLYSYVREHGRDARRMEGFLICELYWGRSELCSVWLVQVGVAVSMLVVGGVSSIYLLANLCSPPHTLLNKIWEVAPLVLFAMAAIHVVALPFMAFSHHSLSASVWRDEMLLMLFRAAFDLAVGALARWPKLRRRIHFGLQQTGEVTAAAAIAAFIGGKDAAEVVAEARRSCCYVSLDDVLEEDMRASTPDSRLSKYAKPCKLADIDAFLSHSWHDPPERKWEALQAWRCAFRMKHAREPRVWIDKYCIDQNDIQRSLMCLPVFLAGCESLLILAGPTYLTRLWCVEEVFIYLQMERDPSSIELRLLSDEVRSHIDQFSVKAARCHLPQDEAMLLATIEAGCRTCEAFDSQVRLALNEALGNSNP